MSLLPAFISARNRKNDSVSSMNAASDSRAGDSSRSDSPASDSDDDVFNLLPPESSAAPEPKPQGRNINPVDMTDLSRLSIDRDGRLYWDCRPARRSLILIQFLNSLIVLVAHLLPTDFSRYASGNKSEGARDAARSSGPAESTGDKNPQVRLLTSVPRALFVRFSSAWHPGG